MKLAPFQDHPVWRVVPTRQPPIALFERAASLEDVEDNLRLEAAFNDHHGDTLAPSLPPRSQWVVGPGSGYIMAPFVYVNPSRFSDGSYGLFYAGCEEATAVQEVAYHRGRFMAATGLAPMVLQHLVLMAAIRGRLVDIRISPRTKATTAELYAPDPERYGPAQAFARKLFEEGRDGLVYSSVRAPGGTCVGVFRPRAVNHCKVARSLSYFWDGTRISAWT